MDVGLELARLLLLGDELGQFEDTNFIDDGLEVEWDFGLFECEDADEPEVSEVSEFAGYIFGEENG